MQSLVLAAAHGLLGRSDRVRRIDCSRCFNKFRTAQWFNGPIIGIVGDDDDIDWIYWEIVLNRMEISGSVEHGMVNHNLIY